MEPKRYQVVSAETNKRKFPRVRLNGPVQLSHGSATPQGGVSSNISLGGLGLRSNRFFPVNSSVDLTIHLVPGKILTCSGQVMWISRVPFAEDEQYHLGVAFDEKFIAESQSDVSRFLNLKLSQSL